MDNIALSVLEGTRELLSNKNRWTAYCSAKDAEGMSVSPNDPKACCWCLMGALIKVSHDTGAPQQIIACRTSEFTACDYLHQSIQDVASAHKWPKRAVPSDVNDILGYEAVMRLIEIAISRVKRISFEI